MTKDPNNLKDWQRYGILGAFLGTLLLISLGLSYLTEFFINQGWVTAGYISFAAATIWNLAIAILCFRILIMSFRKTND